MNTVKQTGPAVPSAIKQVSLQTLSLVTEVVAQGEPVLTEK